MLGKLFGSNSRVKILKVFIYHPGKKYYIRQLARDLKLQVNSIRRELENLEEFGLLTSSNEVGEGENKHEKKYYTLNEDFILYNEVKDLILKAQILYSKDFVEKIAKAGIIKILILTGVFVNEQLSPVDMLIVGKVNKPTLVRRIKELEKEINREINYVVMDMKEFKYRREITDVFLYGIFEGKKITIIDEVGIL